MCAYLDHIFIPGVSFNSKPTVTYKQSSLKMFKENKTMECRLCLRSVSEQSSIPIFGDGNSVQETIWNCCQLQVRKDNWLPNTMCLSCDSNLKSLMDFKQFSTQCEAKARLNLAECTNIKVEEVLLDDHVLESDDNAVQSDIGECDLNPIPINHVSGREQTYPMTDEHSQDLTVPKFVPSKSLVKGKRLLKGSAAAKTKTYKCNICSKCYTAKSSLNVHMNYHTGEKSFKCNICSKVFASQCTLSKHVKLHTGEKLFECDTCSKCFQTKWQLTDHIKYHIGERPYKCEICSKCFVIRSKLTFHMKNHAEERHKCEICSKSFTAQGKLILHMKIHTVEEKPHKCYICSKRFRRKCHLTVHIMNVHNKAPKHQKCNICSKVFSSQAYLTVHMKYHTGKQLYKCDICQKCFAKKSELAIHMRNHTEKM